MASSACGIGLLLGLAGPVGAQGSSDDPPGNNGTVKIDDIPFDAHPDNQPHVGCTFQVDFYGFDEGELEATVLFEAVPPTVSDGEGSGQELLSDTVAIGEDAAGGGTDLDAERTYDLTAALAAITPHPQQGWHVRLTVHAEGSQGADTKFKVFWVSGCEPPGPTTTTSTPPHGSTTSSSTPGGSTTSTTEQGATTTTAAGGGTSTTQPAGVMPTGPTSTSPVGGGALPLTGSNSVPLIIVAVLLMATGAGLVLARRLRLDTAPSTGPES